MTIPLNQSSSPPYYLQSTRNRVEAWSTTRLPFEPKGWLKAFRQDLRTAVRDLHAQRYQLLHAIYASPGCGLCDTENVLLYNVGSPWFTEAARYGLRFERGFHIDAECPCTLVSQPLHFHAYRIDGFDSTPLHWNIERTLATWSFVSDAHAIKACSSIWYAMKRGHITAFTNNSAVPQEYGLRLQLHVPPGTRVGLAHVVKPLFDGIISTLHYHDGTDEFELSQRVAAKLCVDTEEVRGLLQTTTATVLGKRNLLHRFRDSVQWNPQDDTCLMGELLLKESNLPTWTVTGELVEITKR